VEKSYRGREGANECFAILRRAKYLRKKRKKIEYVRTAFYRDPFKLVRGLFNQKNGGQLKATVRGGVSKK